MLPLESILQKFQPEFAKEDKNFLKEFLLWGLVEHEKLSKNRFKKGYQYKDLYSNFLSKL